MRRHANVKKRRSTGPSCRSWPTNTAARSSNSSRSSRSKRRRRSRRSTTVRSPCSRPSVNRSSPLRGKDKHGSMLLKSSGPRSSPSWSRSARKSGSAWQLRRPSDRLQEQNRCSNSNSSKTGIVRTKRMSHPPSTARSRSRRIIRSASVSRRSSPPLKKLKKLRKHQKRR